MNEWLSARVDQVAGWLSSLPRPTPVQWLKAAPFAVVGIAFLVLLLRNADTVDFPSYDPPEGFVPAAPPTTQPPGFELPALAAVAGTTVVPIPPNVGRAHLSGSVTGPLGPVPGAVVRLERSILGEVQVLDLAADAAGRWDAPGIGGGRYRVRAFLPPTLAQRTAEVFLLPDGDERNLDLVVEEFGQPTVSLAAAPQPALLGQQVNVAVRVTGRFVDADGFVGNQPLVGAFVDVSHGSGWERVSAPGSLVTGGDGQVVVTYGCRQVGTITISATVRAIGTAVPVSGSASFECLDPATLNTTTSTTAPSSVDGPGNTTTTSTSAPP